MDVAGIKNKTGILTENVILHEKINKRNKQIKSLKRQLQYVSTLCATNDITIDQSQM